MLLSVVGYPIAHSLSPLLFDYFSTKYDMPIHYSRLAINNIEDFEKFFEENKNIFYGFNVTYPLKKEIYSLWQQYSNIPSSIQSCNTMICKPNISLYNTDILAIKHILSKEIRNNWDQVIILGSGMTASICAWEFINYDKPITIYYHENTNYNYFPKSKNIHWQRLKEFKENIHSKALIINTLSPLANYDFFSNKLSLVTAIIDADYRNRPLENVALSNNIHYIDGYHWLYYQGIESFKLFTNQTNLSVEYDEKWIKTKNYDKISLIGMSGAGKTTAGMQLAKKLNYQFVDIDKLIEKKENKSISTIFSDEGEDFFRQLETQILSEIMKNDKIVISTGGGIIKNKKNREILKKYCYNILLYVNVDVAMQRLHYNKTRPLLSGNMEAKWQEIWIERQSIYYQTADYIINSDKNNIDLVYEDIKEFIKK